MKTGNEELNEKAASVEKTPRMRRREHEAKTGNSCRARRAELPFVECYRARTDPGEGQVLQTRNYGRVWAGDAQEISCARGETVPRQTHSSVFTNGGGLRAQGYARRKTGSDQRLPHAALFPVTGRVPRRQSENPMLVDPKIIKGYPVVDPVCLTHEIQFEPSVARRRADAGVLA